MKLAVPLKSPESPIFLAVCNVVAVLAFHVILPTIFDENVFTPENVCAPAKNATLLLNLASGRVPVERLLALRFVRDDPSQINPVAFTFHTT